MDKLLGLVILVLNIVAIVDCFKTAGDTGKKILWTILILVLPGLGLILYYVIGKKK